MTHRTHSPLDQVLGSMDVALRTLFAKPRAARPMPRPIAQVIDLTSAEQRHAAGLMRVNHVGEICAQALYTAQALTAKTDAQRRQFEQAAQEEIDHLAWTAQRLQDLGGRPSLLNPLWYAGSFGLGLLAGQMGARTSLGFVVETEAQVEAHLASHLQSDADGLPAGDTASRAIVAVMQQDEAAHGLAAKEAGAQELSDANKALMAKAARVMTQTAYWI